MKARFLVDRSALARMKSEPVRQRLGPIIESGQAATCAIVDLEVLYSARNAEDHRRVRRSRRLAYQHVTVDDSTFERAIEVQGLLALQGRHRLPIPDLVIAAAAEQAGLTVLHYDQDFDRIAEVTGQPTEWVAKRGSV